MATNKNTNRVTINSTWVNSDGVTVIIEDVSSKFVWVKSADGIAQDKFDKKEFKENYTKVAVEKAPSTGTRAAKGEKERLLTVAETVIMDLFKSDAINLRTFRRNENYIHAKSDNGNFEAWASGNGFRVTMDPDNALNELGADLGEPNYRKGKTIVLFDESDIETVIKGLLLPQEPEVETEEE